MRLANLADRERDPDRFVALALEEMAAFPWIEGIDWQTSHSSGMAGTCRVMVLRTPSGGSR